MSKQPEALRLAERVVYGCDWYEFDASAWCPQAAAELRRQNTLIAGLRVALREYLDAAEYCGHANDIAASMLRFAAAEDAARAVLAKAEAQQ